jgi:hypothetical protein
VEIQEGKVEKEGWKEKRTGNSGREDGKRKLEAHALKGQSKEIFCL